MPFKTKALMRKGRKQHLLSWGERNGTEDPEKQKREEENRSHDAPKNWNYDASLVRRGERWSGLRNAYGESWGDAGSRAAKCDKPPKEARRGGEKRRKKI